MGFINPLINGGHHPVGIVPFVRPYMDLAKAIDFLKISSSKEAPRGNPWGLTSNWLHLMRLIWPVHLGWWTSLPDPRGNSQRPQLQIFWISRTNLGTIPLFDHGIRFPLCLWQLGDICWVDKFHVWDKENIHQLSQQQWGIYWEYGKKHWV